MAQPPKCKAFLITWTGPCVRELTVGGGSTGYTGSCGCMYVCLFFRFSVYFFSLLYIGVYNIFILFYRKGEKEKGLCMVV